MLRLLRILSVILLLVTGITAIGGGIVLLMDTTGETMQFPIEARMAIQNSILGSFLIPGLSLLFLIGVASIIIAVLGIRKSKLYPWGLFYQGAALLIWLSIQLLLIEDKSPLQIVYGVLGLIFISIGTLIKLQKEY
ncbi:MAG: hypothetical protein JST82_09905 [Bacteroidetes bacterium]|nr:hypothetical protein [Bacteroidota bacterium]